MGDVHKQVYFMEFVLIGKALEIWFRGGNVSYVEKLTTRLKHYRFLL